VLAGVVLAIGAGLYGRTTYEALTEPEIVNYSEGIVLHAAERALAGAPLWGDLRQAPYDYSAYPPLFTVLAGALCGIFGVHLAVVRALAAVAYALALAVAGRIASRESGHAWAGLAAVGLGLGVTSAHPFAAIARVDALEILFGLIALDRVLALERRDAARPRVTAFAAIVAMVLCALTKWTGLAPFVGIALWRAWRARSVRDPALAAVLGGVLASLAAFAIGHVWTGGALTQQVFFDQARSGTILRAFVVVNYVAYQLGPIALALWTVRRGLAHAAASALASSLVWMALSQLKDGADHNYALGPIALTMAIAGAGLPALRDELVRARPTRRVWAEPVLAVFAVVSMGLASLQTSHLEERGPRWRADHAALHARLAAVDTGPILAEEPFYARRHGLASWLTDPCHFQILARHGALSADPLRAALREGRIRWVLRGDVLGGVPGLDAILADHFDEVFRTEGPITTGPLSLHRYRDLTPPE
jgi:hypothetical protein